MEVWNKALVYASGSTENIFVSLSPCSRLTVLPCKILFPKDINEHHIKIDSDSEKEMG